jgi:PEP-CTERM motif
MQVLKPDISDGPKIERLISEHPRKITMPAPFRILSVAVLLVLSLHGRAAIVWAENINGDLSSDPAAPTPITFQLGSNIINGTVFTGTDTRDYITFTIGAGFQLTSLRLLVYDDLGTGTPNDGNTGFHAINLGATSFIPSVLTADQFLGGDHLNPPVGVDLLPTLASAPLAGTGFTVPLGPGTYSYLVQQTGPQVTGYSLEFDVVPEPSSVVLAMVGIGALVRRQRLRK